MFQESTSNYPWSLGAYFFMRYLISNTIERTTIDRRFSIIWSNASAIAPEGYLTLIRHKHFSAPIEYKNPKLKIQTYRFELEIGLEEFYNWIKEKQWEIYCIMKMIISDIKEEHQVNVSKDLMALTRMHESSEKSIAELKYREQSNILIPFISATSGGPIHHSRIITRSDFLNLLKKTVLKNDFD